MNNSDIIFGFYCLYVLLLLVLFNIFIVETGFKNTIKFLIIFFGFISSIIVFITITAFVHSKVVKAEELYNPNVHSYQMIELNELTVDYKNFGVLSDHQRDLLIYPNYIKEGIDVGIKLDLLGAGYFDSTIESETDAAQYAGVGLQSRLGVRLWKSLEFGVYHHSQHVLDTPISSIPKFPSENAIELKFIIYKKDNRDSVF